MSRPRRLVAGVAAKVTELDEQRVVGCTCADHDPSCRVHVQHFAVEFALGVTPDGKARRLRPGGVTRVEVHR